MHEFNQVTLKWNDDMKVTYIGYDPCSPLLASLVERADVHVNRVVTSDQSWGEHVRRIAVRAGIALVYERARQADIERFATDSDLLICAVYDYRLTIPPDTGCTFINVHPSLLPLGRGPTCVQWTLLDQPESAGVTLHLMTSELDAGPIVSQMPLESIHGESYEGYFHRANCAARKLLASLDAATLRQIVPVSQQGRPWSYNPVMPEARRTIVPTLTARQIVRLVSAVGPLGAMVTIDGQKYVVSRAEAFDQTDSPADPAFVNWLYSYYPCKGGYCLFPRDGLKAQPT